MLVYTHVIFGDKLDSIKIRQCSIHRTLLKWTPLREILLHTMVQLFCTPLLLKTRFCWEEVILMASAIFTYFHRMSVETIMWGFSLFCCCCICLFFLLVLFFILLLLWMIQLAGRGWGGVGQGSFSLELYSPCGAKVPLTVNLADLLKVVHREGTGSWGVCNRQSNELYQNKFGPSGYTVKWTIWRQILS